MSKNMNADTVRSRIKRNSITTFNASTHSQIETAEKYMAETITQMAKIKILLSTSKFIQLANSMIEDISHQENLVEFKKNLMVAIDFVLHSSADL